MSVEGARVTGVESLLLLRSASLRSNISDTGSRTISALQSIIGTATN
jgi:hypothetical protein